MRRFPLAAAQRVWAAAFLLLALPLAACASDDARGPERPPVSETDIELLRTEAAARFLSTDAALADVETVVATLDSTGQAGARPRLETLRGSRASLQMQLDTLSASAFPSPEAFGTVASSLRDRIDALDAAIARDRILVEPDASSLRTTATARLAALASRAEVLRADSTASGAKAAASLDSARVRLERTLGLLNRRTVRFDSVRDVLAAGFSDLPGLERDSLVLRLMPDSLR